MNRNLVSLVLLMAGLGLLFGRGPIAVGGLSGVAYRAALRVPEGARPFAATLSAAYTEAGRVEGYTDLVEVQQHVLDKCQRTHGPAFSAGWNDWLKTVAKELQRAPDRDVTTLRQACDQIASGLERVR